MNATKWSYNDIAKNPQYIQQKTTADINSTDEGFDSLYLLEREIDKLYQLGIATEKLMENLRNFAVHVMHTEINENTVYILDENLLVNNMKHEKTKGYTVEFKRLSEREIYTYKNTLSNRIVLGVKTIIENICSDIREVEEKYENCNVVLSPNLKDIQVNLTRCEKEHYSLRMSALDFKYYVDIE